MAKATLTFEDCPGEPGSVTIGLEFDPPAEVGQEFTLAQMMSAHALEAVQALLAEKE